MAKHKNPFAKDDDDADSVDVDVDVDTDDADSPEIDSDVDDQTAEIDAEADTDPAEDMSDSEESDDEFTITVGSVLEKLTTFGLPLPDDTNADNFLDRLNVALMVAIETSEDFQEDEPGMSTETSVVEPRMAAMSLEAKQAIAYGQRAHREKVASSLDALLKSGRCTPAEFRDLEAKTGVLKLSLNSDGEPASSKVEEFIASRAPVPAGTFWSEEERLKKMSVIPHPDAITFGDGSTELSQEEEDAIVERLASR